MTLAGGGWYYFKKKKAENAPRYAPVQAELRDLSEVVDTTGVVAPENRVEIQPSASGRIEEILVEEGETIKAGEVLALKLGSPPYFAVMLWELTERLEGV